MNVLLIADHRLARDAALAALRTDARVGQVTVTDRRLTDAVGSQADLVLFEHSLDRLTVTELDTVLEACPGACVVTVALTARDRYAWIALRSTPGWYAVRETGEGSLHMLLTRLERDRTAALIA